MTYDAVVTYHLNPLACGVSKFNHRLARELGVPCVLLDHVSAYAAPLVSIKPSEMNEMGWSWTNSRSSMSCSYRSSRCILARSRC